MLEELQHVSDTTPADGTTQEPTGVESAAADLPAGGAPANTPSGAPGSGGDKKHWMELFARLGQDCA